MAKIIEPVRERKIFFIAGTLVFLLLLFSGLVYAPPSPHNVQGKILTNSSNGVQNGIPVFINNTVTGDTAYTFVSAPPIPSLRGSYSATITGDDGNAITVWSWNSTHYGYNQTVLLSTTTTANVRLNTSRGSETNVTIFRPLNNTKVNSSVSFNVTANISVIVADGINCNATISFSNNYANITADQNLTNQLGDITQNDFRITTWNVSAYREGIFNITVQGRCGSDDVNFEHVDSQTITLRVNDSTIPIVTLESPQNNSWTQANITFKYNVTEYSDVLNCSLYINEIYNQTSFNVTPFTGQNFTINNTASGTYSWFVSCIDNSSNLNNGNSTTWYIRVDTIPPNITLLSPRNMSIMNSTLAFFRYNVSDNGNVTNCSLVLNNKINQTNHTVIQNISNNFSVDIPITDYNWSVNCTDASGNIGAANDSFTLLYVDLFVNASQIILSTDLLVEYDNITINATIYNLGSGNASNITLQIIEHNGLTGNEYIGENITANISAGGFAVINFSYIVKLGEHTIIVSADRPMEGNGVSLEGNESNNMGNQTIAVSPYHTYYGTIIADIALDNAQDTSLLNWLNDTSYIGNVLVADTDSIISFANITALGRNNSINSTFDDFEELDRMLNISNLTDSINRTFTSNGFPVTTRNMTLFNKQVLYVPVVNSTNSSNFLTGIVWDANDNEKPEYNGSQDIMFVTPLNRNNVGKYGTYDYEIKVPARLAVYVSGGVYNSLSFYREVN